MAHTYKKLPIAIPSLFDTIVSEVSDNLEAEIGTTVKFKHGTWEHIVARLVSESKATSTKNDKYPLIVLIHNFEEPTGGADLTTNVRLNFAICTLSSKGKTSEQRYAQSYLAKLYPIYAEFMQVVADSPYFDGYKAKWYKHTKIDDLHMGETTDTGRNAYKLPDILDGLFIQDLELTIDEQKCTTIINNV